MTKATPRTSSEIIKSLEARLRVLEGSRKFPRNEDGDIDFGTGIDLGNGDRIKYGLPEIVTPTDLILDPGASLNVIYVDVEWTPGVPAPSYDVMVVNNSTGVVESRSTVGGSSTRVSGLEPNVLYDVSVRAMDNVGRTSDALSGQFMSVGDTEEPPEITGLSVSAGVRSLVAVWDESTADDVKNGRGLYEAELWSDDSGSPDALLRTSRTSGTIISWVDLSGSTTYHARVRAIDSSGNEGPFGSFGSATTAEAGGRDFTTDPILETEIADGAISTPKLQANSIDAGKLVTGSAVITQTAQIADAIINSAKIISLNAEKITVGQMSGDRIEANSLSVDRLSSGTLSARTISLASDGMFLANGPAGSLYLSGAGLELFDAPNGGGTRKVFLNAASGTGTFQGVVDVTGIINVSASYAGDTFTTRMAEGLTTFLRNGEVIGRMGGIRSGGANRIKIAHGNWEPGGFASIGGDITLAPLFAALGSSRDDGSGGSVVTSSSGGVLNRVDVSAGRLFETSTLRVRENNVEIFGETGSTSLSVQGEITLGGNLRDPSANGSFWVGYSGNGADILFYGPSHASQAARWVIRSEGSWTMARHHVKNRSVTMYEDLHVDRDVLVGRDVEASRWLVAGEDAKLLNAVVGDTGTGTGWGRTASPGADSTRLVVTNVDADQPSSNAFIKSRVTGSSGGMASLATRANSTATRRHWWIENPNGVVGSITTSGSSTSYNTTSDARLKEEIEDLPGCLDIVKSLHPVRFQWKGETANRGKRVRPESMTEARAIEEGFYEEEDEAVPHAGFLAHEVAEIVPDAVTGKPNEINTKTGEPIPQQMDYSKLIPHLVGAIAELAGRIDDLPAVSSPNR